MRYESEEVGSLLVSGMKASTLSGQRCGVEKLPRGLPDGTFYPYPLSPFLLLSTLSS